MKTPMKAPNLPATSYVGGGQPSPFRLYERPVLATTRQKVRYGLQWGLTGVTFLMNPIAGALIGAAMVCADKADKAAGYINFWESM